MCRECHRMEKRPFHPTDVKTPSKSHVWVAKCKYCKSDGQIGYPVAQPEDCPEPLRNLTPAIVAALRPLDIFCGPYDEPRTATGSTRAWPRSGTRRRRSRTR